MSQQHRRQLFEQNFAMADRQLESSPSDSIAWFAFAAINIADQVGFNRNFDFKDYRDGRFPDDAREWAIKHVDRLTADPINVMSEWIDQHPRACQAVDTYCAARAQEDLARMAQRARPSDLASPEEALALRRNRGRMM